MDDEARQRLAGAEARRELSALLDEVIPPGPDGRLPGAGQLGLADGVLEAAGARPDLAALVAQGLEALASDAAGRGAPGFAALDDGARREAVRALESRVPALLPTLAFVACAAYYAHPAVLEALGLEARPPHPRGYELPPTDFALLEPVRRRPSMVRPPG